MRDVLEGLVRSSVAGRVTPSGRLVDRDRDAVPWSRLTGSGLGLGLALDGDVLTEPARVLTTSSGDDDALRDDDDGGTTSRVL